MRGEVRDTLRNADRGLKVVSAFPYDRNATSTLSIDRND